MFCKQHKLAQGQSLVGRIAVSSGCQVQASRHGIRRHPTVMAVQEVCDRHYFGSAHIFSLVGRETEAVSIDGVPTHPTAVKTALAET